MVRKTAAVVAALVVAIGISIGAVGAFPFHWHSGAAAGNPQSNRMAPNNAPEPGERGTIPLASWAPLVKRIMPTVVNVSVVQTIKSTEFGEQQSPGDNGDQGNGFGPGNPFGANPFGPFSFFFGQIPHQFTQHGLGSGVIVSKDGYVLTNYHVVQHANRIKVTLMDGRAFSARIIGADEKTDVALIKIDAGKPLPYAQLGDSNRAEVGDWVIAIGNPFGFNLTVTAGIISAKGRALGGNYDNYIQTDASINPGNSGGPLFNTEGKVIGINTAIYSNTGTNAGIGFAIPIDLAKDIMDQLKEHGHVIRGWLGVEIQEVIPDLAQSFSLAKPEGALVASVVEDGPAAKAGVKRGDIILKFNGRPVPDEHHLPEMVAQTPINGTVPLEILRDGKKMTLDVKIGELKETKLASAKSEESNNNWGLQVQALTPEIAQQLNLKLSKGVVVRGVTPDTPGADAGIQPGDVVLEVNHRKIGSVDDFLSEAKSAKSSKKPTLLLVQRGDATLYTVIKPEG